MLAASPRVRHRRWGRLGVPLAWLRVCLDTLWHAPPLHVARDRGLGWRHPGERRSLAGTARHLLRALREDAGSGTRHLLRNRAFTLTAVGILARILWLTGCEPGRNRGGECDTLRRFIYIHGTPDDTPMGVPGSHGCIRMRNGDLLDLFALVEAGTPVDIVPDGQET